MRGARRLGPLLLLAAAGCSPAPDGALQVDDSDPTLLAHGLFRLARSSDPAEEELGAWFDADLLSAQRTALLDALDELAGFPAPALDASQTTLTAREAFVDLVSELPEGGAATFTVQLEPTIGESAWRIRWFQGPGVEWPRFRATGDSLSTSAPPPAR